MSKNDKFVTDNFHCIVYLPYTYFGVGSSRTPVSIAEHFASTGLDARLYVPSAVASPPAVLRAVTGLPMVLPKKLRRGRFHSWAVGRIEARLLAEVRRRGAGTVVWLWPDARIETVSALKDSGAILVREMINTHRGTARRILDAEEIRVGVTDIYSISQKSVEQECAEL